MFTDLKKLDKFHEEYEERSRNFAIFMKELNEESERRLEERRKNNNGTKKSYS